MVGCGHLFAQSVNGLVPGPTGTIGTTRFLCENGNWSEPLNPVTSAYSDQTQDVYFPLILKYTANTNNENNYLRFSASSLNSQGNKFLASTLDGDLKVRSLDSIIDVVAGGDLSVTGDASVGGSLTVTGTISGLLNTNPSLSNTSLLTLADQPITTVANTLTRVKYPYGIGARQSSKTAARYSGRYFM